MSASTTTPRIVGDRLYGINMRAQELALYGERVRFQLRYSPIFDEPVEAQTQHFKLLVLEIDCELDADDELGRQGRRLELLKCGWELELSSAEPLRADELGEDAGELPLLLGRIADTVNELARRAGLEAPLGPDVVDELIRSYRG